MTAVYWDAPVEGRDGQFYLGKKSLQKKAKEIERELLEWVVDERLFCSDKTCPLCTEEPEQDWADLEETPEKPVRRRGKKNNNAPAATIPKLRLSVSEARARRRTSDDVHITVIPKHGPRAPRWFRMLQMTPFPEDPEDVLPIKYALIRQDTDCAQWMHRWTALRLKNLDIRELDEYIACVISWTWKNPDPTVPSVGHEPADLVCLWNNVTKKMSLISNCTRSKPCRSRHWFPQVWCGFGCPSSGQWMLFWKWRRCVFSWSSP